MTFYRDQLEDIVIDSTIGRHDADLAFPEFLDFDDEAKASSWRKTGLSGFNFLEWRGAVIPRQNDWPTQTFGIEIADPQVWSMSVNGQWSLAYDVELVGTGKGGYLGDDDMPSQNPFERGRGRNTWERIGVDHYHTRWMVDSLLFHFWAGRKSKAPAGHAAELSCGLIRLTNQPPNQILGGIGIDYYPSATTNSNKAPGPGIQRYRTLSTEWEPFAWLTPTNDVPYSVSAIRSFMDQRGLPPVKMLDRLPERDQLPDPVGPTNPAPDNSEILAELAALRAEIVELRSEVLNLGPWNVTYTGSAVVSEET